MVIPNFKIRFFWHKDRFKAVGASGIHWCDLKRVKGPYDDPMKDRFKVIWNHDTVEVEREMPQLWEDLKGEHDIHWLQTSVEKAISMTIWKTRGMQ